MSGGPIINDLGEVVGIITFVLSDPRVAESQPVALPVYLLRKYLMKYASAEIK